MERKGKDEHSADRQFVDKYVAGDMQAREAFLNQYSGLIYYCAACITTTKASFKKGAAKGKKGMFEQKGHSVTEEAQDAYLWLVQHRLTAILQRFDASMSLNDFLKLRFLERSELRNLRNDYLKHIYGNCYDRPEVLKNLGKAKKTSSEFADFLAYKYDGTPDRSTVEAEARIFREVFSECCMGKQSDKIVFLLKQKSLKEQNSRYGQIAGALDRQDVEDYLQVLERILHKQNLLHRMKCRRTAAVNPENSIDFSELKTSYRAACKLMTNNEKEFLNKYYQFPGNNAQLTREYYLKSKKTLPDNLDLTKLSEQEQITQISKLAERLRYKLTKLWRKCHRGDHADKLNVSVTLIFLKEYGVLS